MKAKGVVVACVLVALVAGCAMFQVKPWSERTPEEKSSYFMAIYNAQYRDTLAMAGNPSITDAQREIVRKKKKILTELWPAIQAYDTVVVHGGTPTPSGEEAILNYLNRLAAMGG